MINNEEHRSISSCMHAYITYQLYEGHYHTLDNYKIEDEKIWNVNDENLFIQTKYNDNYRNFVGFLIEEGMPGPCLYYIDFHLDLTDKKENNVYKNITQLQSIFFNIESSWDTFDPCLAEFIIEIIYNYLISILNEI